MPKQTFLQLSKDKQDTLILAAKKEFSRVPLHEASIANIIKSAGIPRGSFYQYFDGKDDLYYYLLDNLAHKINNKFIIVLMENNGDLLESLVKFYQYLIKKRENEENTGFFKNVFLNMNYKIENTLAKNLFEQNQQHQFLGFIKRMNTSNLNIQDERELHHLIKIILSVTFHNLVEMYVRDLSEEEALHNYMVEISLLKRGFYKG